MDQLCFAKFFVNNIESVLYLLFYFKNLKKWNKNNINRPCTGKAYSFPLQSQLKI